MRYYYSDKNRQPVGPLSADEVLGLFRKGLVDGDTPLLRDGATDWGTVNTLLRPSNVRAAVYTPDSDASRAAALADAARVTTQCAYCRARIASDSAWCGNCQMSTKPFVRAKLASAMRRVGAALLDQAIPSTLGVLVGINGAMHIGQRRGLFGAGVVMFAYMVYACTLYARGTSPGKNLLGMEVVGEDGDPIGFWRMAVRQWIAKPFSMIVFGLGYLWILIDDERQGWHDKILDTWVVERVDG